MKLKGLLIDHDDSFTFNVKAWLNQKFEIEVIHHHSLNVDNTKYDFIILSPGPKSPEDYSHSLKFITSTNLPVIGICLGMQMINHLEGGGITPYTPPVHGKSSQLTSQIESLHNLTVARYHSLKCEVNENKFRVIATSENLPMIIQHKIKPWLGFQFHPESFLTEKNEIYLKMISNLLEEKQRG